MKRILLLGVGLSLASSIPTSQPAHAQAQTRCVGQSGEELAKCCEAAALRKYGKRQPDGSYVAQNATYKLAANGCVSTSGHMLP